MIILPITDLEKRKKNSHVFKDINLNDIKQNIDLIKYMDIDQAFLLILADNSKETEN
jgi:hypothetical protein